MRWPLKLFVSLLFVAAAGTGGAEKPEHIESPPVNITPSEFATDYSGCLGPLRSWLAQYPGFEAEFNPGLHQGSVGEEEFLKNSFGIESDEELAEFCAAAE